MGTVSTMVGTSLLVLFLGLVRAAPVTETANVLSLSETGKSRTIGYSTAMILQDMGVEEDDAFDCDWYSAPPGSEPDLPRAAVFAGGLPAVLEREVGGLCGMDVRVQQETPQGHPAHHTRGSPLQMHARQVGPGPKRERAGRHGHLRVVHDEHQHQLTLHPPRPMVRTEFINHKIDKRVCGATTAPPSPNGRAALFRADRKVANSVE